jgi:Asp-tRNA(Asn)/Glu-tRNA(Gln) amidotransferase A subunit family amidase
MNDQVNSAWAINRASALDLAPLLQRRELSAEAVARACLERVEQREQAIGAWSFLDAGKLLSQARALDAQPVRGPLHGLPVGIKDIMATADMPTEYGSPIYRNHRPAWDAACVAAIRAAGGLIMGKTVTTEFAAMHPGKTVNPCNPAHTPGGSSSGSAAAVADFMAPFSLGTQTGGSVIRPASFCGIVGYKPSFGMINRHGVKPLSESLDTVGVLARSVGDAALLCAAITGRAGLTDPFPVQAPRIGIWRTYEWSKASSESIAAVERAASVFAAAGAQVREASMPELLAGLDEAHHTIEYHEMAGSLAFERQQHGDRLSANLSERLEKGRNIVPALYDQALAVADACRRLIAGVFVDFDVLLTPSATGEAPQGLGSTGNAVFNRGWTLLRVPCVTFPAWHGPKGLPVGVQLVGAFREDRKALSIARWAERALAALA